MFYYHYLLKFYFTLPFRLVSSITGQLLYNLSVYYLCLLIEQSLSVQISAKQIDTFSSHNALAQLAEVPGFAISGGGLTLDWYQFYFTLPFRLVSLITGQLLYNLYVYYLCLLIEQSLSVQISAKQIDTFISFDYIIFVQRLILIQDMK
ncbi:unnamed protein product [Rotaria sordida]|uniref:Uncharacterized protein n=1 Tax=Rotaria sordida TaxID=392033 RepID=A0A814MWP9_9BILA|nr:unnamed protein product [Rotaria sordida]